MPTIKRIIGSFVGIALGACAHVTQATPLLYTQSVSQYVEAGNFSGELRDGHADSVLVPPAQTHLISHAGGYADGYASATFGTLKGRVAAYEPLGGGGHVNVGVNAYFVDSLTITNPTLAFGDLVDVLFTLFVDPASTMSPDPRTFLPIFPYAGYDTGLRARLDFTIGDRPAFGKYDWNAFEHDANEQVIIYHGRVGETITFAYQLSLSDFVIDDVGHNAGEIDFANSAHLYIAPGLSTTLLQSGSGFDYSQAVAGVPEPGSLMLAGAGLLCLAFRSKRRTICRMAGTASGAHPAST